MDKISDYKINKREIKEEVFGTFSQRHSIFFWGGRK